MTNTKIKTSSISAQNAATESDQSDFIGMFPAAGHATRLANSQSRLQCSKEIVKVPDLQNAKKKIAVGDYLMREYQAAQISDVVVIRREEKHDIRTHYTNPAFSDLNIIDIVTPKTASTAHSLDKAWHLFNQRPVALGFPDIIIDPPGVFTALCQQIRQVECDVCLGLFPATHPSQSDMVSYTEQQVRAIHVKPQETQLTMTWSCAVWQPSFSRFLHESLKNHTSADEFFIGHAFQAAIDAGLLIRALPFERSLSLDIGTPASFEQAQKLQRQNHS